MISKGANINAKGNYDSTPLHYAAIWRKKLVFSYLIEKGCDLWAMNNERKTAMEYL